MTPLMECDRCHVTMRPEVGAPRGNRLSTSLFSRIECTNCGRKLGTANWEML